MEQKETKQRQDYWAIELQQWAESGESGLQYCKENHLSYSRFAYWRKKLDIQGKPAARSHTRRDRFTKVVPRPAQEQPPAADPGLTMSLPNGITLQGIRGGHIKLIGQLLRQL